MKFVFWQNMVSIHQVPLLQALSQQHEVKLVVPQVFENERRNQGWNIPTLNGIELLVSPSENQIDKELSNSANHHIFSGINAYPFVYSAFKKAIRHSENIYIYAEPYDNRGCKGVLRYFMYRILARRFSSKIKAILATGENGVACYQKAGFQSNKVYEWGYFTNINKESLSCESNQRLHILYVGQLIPRKAIIPFIQCFLSLAESTDVDLTIVGEGIQKEEILKLCPRHDNIYFKGAIPNEQISSFMSQADLLVLPSIHDGWGAVVNEALQSGCRVLCSSACGVASLVKNQSFGSVFDWKITNDLNNKLQEHLMEKPLTMQQRDKIREWAKTAISGISAAKYLEQIVSYANGITTTKPLPPWKQHK